MLIVVGCCWMIICVHLPQVWWFCLSILGMMVFFDMGKYGFCTAILFVQECRVLGPAVGSTAKLWQSQHPLVELDMDSHHIFFRSPLGFHQLFPMGFYVPSSQLQEHHLLSMVRHLGHLAAQTWQTTANTLSTPSADLIIQRHADRTVPANQPPCQSLK